MLGGLLNGVIRFALHQRVLIAVLAVFLMVYGSRQIAELPIDVFPNLDRPRVVVMTEAHGLAPEEVETLVTIPLESALNGATGVQAVRTSSGIGLSVVYVEFDWGTDIFNDRQIVAERLALAREQMPSGVTPQLAPISSVMGQIMMIGIWSDDGSTSPMRLRTLADWVVRQRLLTLPGVSQVFVMGGERKQFQVLVDPNELLRYGVTLDEVKTALSESNDNATGGYLDEQGPNELLVRSLGRIGSVEELEGVTGEIHRCGTMEAAAEKLAELVEGLDAEFIGRTDHALCAELVAELPPECFINDNVDPTELAKLPAALVAADTLLADTGSAMVACATPHHRLMCYLPPVCIVIAKTEQLVEHMPAAWEQIAARAADPELRGEFVFITGPSRTADIEKILILGVHGPKRLVVLLVG